jgi:hypothetical protein
MGVLETEPLLAGDEGEAFAELQQELLQPVDDRLLQIVLVQQAVIR